MVLALALGNLSLCAALFFFEYESKKSLTLSTWAVARQCQALAWMLLYFRGTGIIPDLISIPFGYAILFAGVALEAGALWQAADRHGWLQLTVPMLALGLLAFLVAYFNDDPSWRVAVSSVVLAGFYLSGAAALARKWAHATMLRRFLAITVALLALVIGARGVMAVLLPEGWGWLSGPLVQMLASGAFYLLMLVAAFGYLLLSREQVQQELARLAVVDALTDVPNRRGFFNTLAPWMALARRPGLPTSLIVFDFDHFKRVNDGYGHSVGDTVLRAIVDVCKQQLRDSDQIGRLGGAEFAILLPRTNLAEAAMVAERMREAIAANPVKSERAVINLTASLGVTTIRADDSSVSLFKRADEALQKAKRAGRNTVVEAQAPVVLDATP
jgi:diguanylate cyclase (GGDEF)-like protein